MKKIQFSLLIATFSIIFVTQAQSDFSSPYSLFGLGEENVNYFGGYSALGNTGIASKNLFSINKANPASIASIASNTFLYELGLNGTYSDKKTLNSSQNNLDFNISHLAMAFQVKNYWKVNFGLVPYSKVSYEINLKTPVEGSVEYLNSTVTGSGGINEVFFGNGFNLSKNLSVGVELSALFGNISEEQLLNIGTYSATITDSKNYFGLGLTAGLQYSINNIIGKETTFGATLNLPTSLNGTEDETGTKSFTGSDVISILDETDIDINDFELPLKVGFGISSIINKSLTVNVDYKKNYWSNTNNSNNIYKNQEIYGVGFEYKPSKSIATVWNKLKYRVGANYNSGNLILSKQKIDNYAFSLGVGIPLSKSIYSSMININYSYGKEGTLNNQLIQDNYHKISINLSLLGNWFKKATIF
ncbi:OmpP1/FadL family transporter [Lutibacter citreus]|uniref:OmpP1/FadL family transporter n=1 Tax=Lutibacter citreus TaxID=2138210 RepID=UPI000DBE2142|nr:hypothetical protein [Lutibacter citreus]